MRDGRSSWAATRFNLSQAYFSTEVSQYDPTQAGTRGMAVIDKDPADIKSITTTFNEDFPPYRPWSGSDRPELVWAPAGKDWSPSGNAIDVFAKILDGAKKSIDAYVQVFDDPSVMLEPLINAANRGVRIRVVTNAKTGIAPAILPKLRRAGVQVVQNPASVSDPSKYMYVHTKTIVVDHGEPTAVAFVGSENPFLNDSLYRERELGVLLKDTDSVNRAHDVFDRDFSNGKPYVAVTPSPSPSGSKSKKS